MDSTERLGGRHNNVRNALIGTFVVVLSVVALLMILHDFVGPSKDAGTMSGAEYRSLRIGESRRAVESRLGRPSTNIPAPPLPTQLDTDTCVYYSESNAIMDPSIFRLCYSGNLLVSKAEFDKIGATTPIDSVP